MLLQPAQSNPLRLIAVRYRPLTIATTRLPTSSALRIPLLLYSSYKHTTCSIPQNRAMSLTSVFSPDAAPPAGPYSQAIKAAGLVFVSGQIPADSNGDVLEGSIEECTELCLKNLTAVLKAAGTDITKVCKTTVFLADMGDFARVNSVYGKYFTGDSKPARSCVAVKTLPKNVRVEIECIAVQ